MAKNSLRRSKNKFCGLSAETLAIILVTVFLLSLCLYVYIGIRQYDDKTLRIMTTIFKERYNESNKGEAIMPSVADRAAATFRDYPLTMLFLVGSFLALSAWNRRKNANLQATLCALFLLLGIGCSTKVMFQGFYGLKGEAGFLFMSVLVMVATFFIWRWMRHQLPTVLYFILVGLILFMVGLNVLAILKDEYTNGAANWTSLFGIQIQPSEFIKAGLILLASCSFYPGYRKIVYVALAGLSALVVAAAGDIGSAVVIAALFFFMVMVLFDEEWITFSLLALFVVAMIIIFKYHPTAKQRLGDWGIAMTNTERFQQKNFLSAIVRAGWFGHGMKGARNFFEVTAGGTDGVLGCIQAVFGMPMLLTAMGSYILLVLQCGFSRNVNPSSHPILMQIAIMITVQVLLNYGGSLDVIPFTGITAPLLSQGGTSTLCTMALMGVMCAALYSSVNGPNDNETEDDFYA